MAARGPQTKGGCITGFASKHILYINPYITLPAISDTGLHAGRTPKCIFHWDYNCPELALQQALKIQ
jgi:hypothetical protein